jgi:exosortase
MQMATGFPFLAGCVSTRRSRYAAGAFLLLALSIVYTYAGVAAALVVQWRDDSNYSHAFLVLPLAVWFGWCRRHRLGACAIRPSLWGLVVVSMSLAAYAVGIAAAELFLARASFIGVLAGATLFFWGREWLRVLAFPLAFLFLMIPLPEIVFSQIALPLQLFASRAGEVLVRGAGVPVLRDGNVLELVSMRLEVAEACSGIRSIVSLLTFAIVLGELGRYSGPRKLILVASTVPIAVAANALRVAGTGLAAQAWGPAAAEGLLHGTSGLLVFGVAVAGLFAVERSMARVALVPGRSARS